MKVFSLRISDELYSALKELAEKERRSLNSEILHIIEDYIKRQEEAKNKSQA